MTSEQIQDYVYNYLIKYLPFSSVCAIMGNISQECSWNPYEVEKGNNIGYGLCQWSFERRQALEKFGTDLESQCKFIIKEIDTQWINTKGYTKETFKNGNYIVVEATSAFCWCWERPNVNEANLSYRQSEALRFYNKYALDHLSFKPNGSILQLQSIIKVNNDGIAGKQTLSACPLLKCGDSGNIVKWLQYCLNSLINAGLSIDGIYEGETFKGVMEYQRRHNLCIDGIFGQESWRCILHL